MSDTRSSPRSYLHRKLVRWTGPFRTNQPSSLAGALAPRSPAVHETTFPVALNNPLSVLGEKYQPSKRLHHYLPFSWLHFRDIRENVRTVCEIGLQTDSSLRMWEEFFPKATICGIDFNPPARNSKADGDEFLLAIRATGPFCTR